MQAAKKVTLVPPKQMGGSIDEMRPADSGSLCIEVDKVDKIKHKIYDKIHLFIKVILKLAKYEAYDADSLRIKSKNGNF